LWKNIIKENNVEIKDILNFFVEGDNFNYFHQHKYEVEMTNEARSEGN